MLNFEGISFCADINPCEVNFRTKLPIPASTVLKRMQSVLHLAEPYYSDSVWRLPIPVTDGGKKIFPSNMIKSSDPRAERHLFAELTVNCLSVGENVFVLRANSIPDYCPYAEVLVATKDIVQKLGKKCQSDYGVYSVRSCLDRGTPATPSELTLYLQSPAKEKFKITTDDFQKSIIYWSSIVTRSSNSY